jgi:hypothetical protein
MTARHATPRRHPTTTRAKTRTSTRETATSAPTTHARRVARVAAPLTLSPPARVREDKKSCHPCHPRHPRATPTTQAATHATRAHPGGPNRCLPCASLLVAVPSESRCRTSERSGSRANAVAGRARRSEVEP